MRRINSSLKVNFSSEKGADAIGKTYFAYIPLEDMVCYAVAESYDSDSDINSAQLAVESVLVAFERDPSFKNIGQYIQYAHDQIVANSAKNRLEAAITVVVSDYTRIKYASCGNVKFYLLNDNAFSLKGETQTYFKFAADEYGIDKAPPSENINLLQYLGKQGRPKPYISGKVDLPEGSTMLFMTSGLCELIDDVEILDAYEESEPESFMGSIQELYLFTQLKGTAIRSYSVASVHAEKTFKEDTAKKNKRRKLIIKIAVIALIVAVIVAIVIGIMRFVDRRAMDEIIGLDNKGMGFSKNGYYLEAHEIYKRASELTEKLGKNWQYTKEKKALADKIAARLRLFDSIATGDSYLDNKDYKNARGSFLDAQDALGEVFGTEEAYSGLVMSNKITDKLELVDKYLTAYALIEAGDMYELQGQYAVTIAELTTDTYVRQYTEALGCYREAETIAIAIADPELRKELLLKISEVTKKIEQEKAVTQIYERARQAEATYRYEEALRHYQTILGIFGEMKIGPGNSRYGLIEDTIARVENIIKSRPPEDSQGIDAAVSAAEQRAAEAMAALEAAEAQAAEDARKAEEAKKAEEARIAAARDAVAGMTVTQGAASGATVSPEAIVLTEAG